MAFADILSFCFGNLFGICNCTCRNSTKRPNHISKKSLRNILREKNRISFKTNFYFLFQNKIKSIDDDNDLSDGLLVGKLRKFWISISNPIFYKPMNLLFVMAVSIEWSSFPILGFYMVTIFKVFFD